MIISPLRRLAVFTTTWTLVTALQANFSTVFEVCPAPYQEGIYPSNWTTYHSLDRLALCNQTQLLDFAVYNPIDSPNTHISIRATYGVPDTFVSNEAARRENAEVSAKCGTATKTAVTVQRASWGKEKSLDIESTQNVVEAAKQIQRFLSADEQCDLNLIFGYAQEGAVAVGTYVGGRMDNHGAANTVIQQFINHVETNGMSQKLLFQYCGVDADYVFGIVASTAANNLPDVQSIIRSWADGKCVIDHDSIEEIPNVDVWMFPETGILSLAPVSNGTSSNSTQHSNSARNIRPDHHLSNQHNKRAECTKYKSVASGDICETLVTKCAITAAQFTSYNPAPNLCSTLVVGQVVCCSAGTVPDLSPKPGADGSCSSYPVKSGEFCAAIAAANSITVEKIESYNTKTWGWMGCNSLQSGQKICLSTGSPPMPAAVVNTVCGPQVPGTPKPAASVALASLNPCPLNACCNIWGQCGTTSEFCTISSSPTGAPGTSAPGINGCISNCGTAIVNNSNPPASFLKIGYFEAWNLERPCHRMDVSSIDTSQYTHIHFAFAIVTDDYRVDIDAVADQFNKFLALKGTKRILSFGGWSFSTDQDSQPIFGNAVSAANRKKFADNVVEFVIATGLDGVDFDWEYPGAPDIPVGVGGNPADGENYYQFLVQVRAGLNAKDASKSLSIAMPASFWYLKGFPVSKLTTYLNYVVYMTYDLHGQWDYNNQWSSPGCPSGNCLRSHTNMTETINALSMLTKAGMPASKIIVGVPSYGRSFKMTTAGCTGPMCTFTGPLSGAAKGRCTGTAGYISNSEIKEIINRGVNIQKIWNVDELTDILVYDSTEWVAYMSAATRETRTAKYKSLNMGGTVDWAIDLGFDIVDPGNPDGTTPASSALGPGTTSIRYLSPTSATVVPFSATAVQATATFTLSGPVVSEIWDLPNTGNQNQPKGPGDDKCDKCDLARLITSTCCGVGGSISNPIVIPAGVALPRQLNLPAGFVPNQAITDVNGGVHAAGQPLSEEIVIPGWTVFPFGLAIPKGLTLGSTTTAGQIEDQDQYNQTMYLAATFWDKPTATCSYPCTLVFPPIITTTTWTVGPIITTVSGSSTTIILPPFTTKKIRISTTVVTSASGSSPTKTFSPLPAPKPLCLKITVPFLGTLTFGLCPPSLSPFPPSVPEVKIIPVPPGGAPGPINSQNKPSPDQKDSENEENDDDDEDEEGPQSCGLEEYDGSEEDFDDDWLESPGAATTGAGIGNPGTSVVTVTATVTSTTVSTVVVITTVTNSKTSTISSTKSATITATGPHSVSITRPMPTATATPPPMTDITCYTSGAYVFGDVSSAAAIAFCTGVSASFTQGNDFLQLRTQIDSSTASTLEDGKILHRDISENNIIITEAASKGEPTGRLIDLDLAKELDSVPSGASHRTGTMQFMAIEVLHGKGHTYRHDLESFFYVLIWMCIRYGHVDMDDGQARKSRQLTSALRDWYTGTYRQIASTKLGHMDKNGFEGIIAEFAPRFENLKKLARELRNVLFPIRDGAIFTGTFRDNDIMYDGMIEAFNKAIATLGKEDQEEYCEAHSLL
ncbi:hypothetical protein VE00_10085 [Pseudogymnoascus sp. WSF 3629]|nr:hypothetical protein VE00_10085 [Pseudogymnoascus sp. WSF 3629]